MVVKKLAQYYQIFCNLSLDVVAGIYFLMVPLPYFFNFDEPLAWYVALPAAAWLIYINDHWLDHFDKNKKTEQRYLFIYRYYKYLIPVEVLLIIVSVALVFKQFDERAATYGIIFSIVCIIYLAFIHFYYREGKWKDTMVSFIYPAGIYLYPFVQNMDKPEVLVFVGSRFIVLLIAVFINLKTTAYFEGDCRNNKIKTKIYFWSVIAFIIGVLSYFYLSSTVIFLITSYLIIIFTHIVIITKKEMFMKHESYRKWSEAMFWIPGILYLLLF